MLAGELDQRAVPHGPGEVQVQMCLGESVQRTCHLHILPHVADPAGGIPPCPAPPPYPVPCRAPPPCPAASVPLPCRRRVPSSTGAAVRRHRARTTFRTRPEFRSRHPEADVRIVGISGTVPPDGRIVRQLARYG
ncbi:hypothetical protein GCM10010466_10150 [Planomonospora alba]|uniref:Uncharacterized protein n=1 Tax=Planomonospora alba TaxID=161354 RepID=A0ABP6MU58_9ACTN